MVEKIHKHFEIPRKIPDVPRSSLDFFCRTVGSTGVIPVRYRLALFDSRFHFNDQSVSCVQGSVSKPVFSKKWWEKYINILKYREKFQMFLEVARIFFVGQLAVLE